MRSSSSFGSGTARCAAFVSRSVVAVRSGRDSEEGGVIILSIVTSNKLQKRALPIGCERNDTHFEECRRGDWPVVAVRMQPCSSGGYPGARHSNFNSYHQLQ